MTEHTPDLSPAAIKVMERSVGLNLLREWSAGKGIVFYPENLNRIVADSQADLLAEVTRLREVNAGLVGALRDAREDVEGWAAYADDYFRGKHRIDLDLARIDAALRAAEDGA